MKTPRKLAVYAAIAWVTGVGGANIGCMSGASYPGMNKVDADARFPLLRVENRNWADVRVYIVPEVGQPVRLGTITSMQTVLLRIRHPLGNGVARILIQPIGSRASYTTESVIIEPGRRLELVVQSSLSLSSLAAW
jgi:hypothetical protein